MELKQTKKPARSALGRGLSALISSTAVPISLPSSESSVAELAKIVQFPEPITAAAEDDTEGSALRPKVRFVEVNKIINNPTQPRQEFRQVELDELANSIRQVGVLQPVLLRPSEDPTRYEIVAGERRWRAAKLAGATQIPAIIKDIDDKLALEIAIIENVQRENLSPLEQAQAYQRLAEEFQLSQNEIADKVGKDRASVANYLRLLKLPKEVAELLNEEKITMGHAKAILSIKEPIAQVSLAKKVVSEGLSVRALEALVSRVVVLDAGRAAKEQSTAPARGSAEEHGASNYPDVIDRMRRALGTKVRIKHHPSGRGRIEIEYFSEQELDRIIELICL